MLVKGHRNLLQDVMESEEWNVEGTATMRCSGEVSVFREGKVCVPVVCYSF